MIKQIEKLTELFFVAATMFTFATNAWAYDGSVIAPSGQTIYYNYYSSSQTIAITHPNTVNAPWWNYTTPAGTLVIPDSIVHNGVSYPVTAIGASAFRYCNTITSVILGNNVISIGDNAFDHCYNMVSINFGNTVTTIGSFAFCFCRALSSIDIPNSVTSIDSYAFSDCYNLDTVHIGSGVTSIGSNAFINCTTMTSIIIPDNVISIGSNAFASCSGITHVAIGSGLSYIGEFAFVCINLREVHIKNPIPPTLGGYEAFSIHTNPDTTHLYVPCGASSAYQSAAHWSNFAISEDLMYSFSATSADTTNGTVQIIQAPNCSNSQAVVQAYANVGFHFDHWSNGSTTNPLTFSLTCDTSIVAYFEVNAPDTLWRTVTVTANVAGACETYGSGVYADSSIVEIGYIVPDTTTDGGHWQFLGWNDGGTGNPRHILVTSDTAIIALFEWVADSTESIDELSTSNSQFSIYPNPASMTVTVETNQPSTLTLTDASGRECGQWKVAGGKTTLDISTFPAGVYFVLLSTSPTIRKLIIR